MRDVSNVTEVTESQGKDQKEDPGEAIGSNRGIESYYDGEGEHYGSGDTLDITEELIFSLETLREYCESLPSPMPDSSLLYLREVPAFSNIHTTNNIEPVCV